jgi:Domain of unknown function (DUF222)
MLPRTRVVEQELGAIVNDLAPHALSGSDAVELVGVFAKIEKLASVGRVLVAQRVEDTGAHRRQGYRSAAHLMAKQSGSSLGSAIAAMETAKKVGRLPRTEKAMREGRLSPQQASEVASGASADPSAEGDLLNSADRDGLKGLKDKTRAVKAAARSEREERAKEEAIRKNRSFRSWNDDDGTFNYAGKTTNDIGARMLAVMEAFKNQAFQDARQQGRREPHEAYAADAMAAMVEAADTDDAPSPPAASNRATGTSGSNPSSGANPMGESPDRRSRDAAFAEADPANLWGEPEPADPTDVADLVRRAAARARDAADRARAAAAAPSRADDAPSQADQPPPPVGAEPRADRDHPAPPAGPAAPDAVAAGSAPPGEPPGRPIPAENSQQPAAQREPDRLGSRREPDDTSAPPGPTDSPTTPRDSNPPGSSRAQRRRRARAGPRAMIHFRVDYAAYLRGYTEPGEMCEIPGVGPVSVATVRAWSHDAVLKALLMDGTDIRTVVHLGRTVTAAQRTALEERDPECVIDACHVRDHLEIDHVADWAVTEITTLNCLARLCCWHHYLKTHCGFTLHGEPGDWHLEPPDPE